MSFKNGKSKPIPIPKKNSIDRTNNFNISNQNYDKYIYKSPHSDLNKKDEKEEFIENFLYMSDNFNPNKPPIHSPPISDSFKKAYLERVANKIMIH